MRSLNQIPIPGLYISAEAAAKLRDECKKLPGWTLTPGQISDLKLLMNGGLFPLKGFMTQADCKTVAQNMRLSSGAIWPMPVRLLVSDDFAARVEPGNDIALNDGQDVLAILSVTDHWKPDADGPFCLGGRVKGIREPEGSDQSPNQLRAHFHEHDLKEVLCSVGREPGDRDELNFFSPPEADIPIKTISIPVNSLPDMPRRRDILLGILARNFGATHVIAPNDAETSDLLKEAGLKLIDPTRIKS